MSLVSNWLLWSKQDYPRACLLECSLCKRLEELNKVPPFDKNVCPTLANACCNYIAIHSSNLLNEVTIQGLPLPVLQHLTSFLSVNDLIRLSTVLKTKGIDTELAWRRHLLLTLNRSHLLKVITAPIFRLSILKSVDNDGYYTAQEYYVSILQKQIVEELYFQQVKHMYNCAKRCYNRCIQYLQNSKTLSLTSILLNNLHFNAEILNTDCDHFKDTFESLKSSLNHVTVARDHVLRSDDFPDLRLLMGNLVSEGNLKHISYEYKKRLDSNEDFKIGVPYLRDDGCSLPDNQGFIRCLTFKFQFLSFSTLSYLLHEVHDVMKCQPRLEQLNIELASSGVIYSTDLNEFMGLIAETSTISNFCVDLFTGLSISSDILDVLLNVSRVRRRRTLTYLRLAGFYFVRRPCDQRVDVPVKAVESLHLYHCDTDTKPECSLTRFLSLNIGLKELIIEECSSPQFMEANLKKILAKLPQLRTLGYLADPDFDNVTLTPDIFQELTSMKQLVHLILKDCHIKGHEKSFVDVLQSMASLRHLQLKNIWLESAAEQFLFDIFVNGCSLRPVNLILECCKIPGQSLLRLCEHVQQTNSAIKHKVSYLDLSFNIVSRRQQLMLKKSLYSFTELLGLDISDNTALEFLAQM